jgi:hypothetical protein
MQAAAWVFLLAAVGLIVAVSDGGKQLTTKRS